MIYLSQRDPKWAKVKLGSSSLEMWRWGCTTTCISMLSDYFKCYRTPDEIAKEKRNYTPDGLILWGKLNFSKMAFEWRQYGCNEARIDASLKDPKKAVILQVDGGRHWVVALRKAFWTNDYVILDPWDGKKTMAKGRYRNITGSAHFVGK